MRIVKKEAIQEQPPVVDMGAVASLLRAATAKIDSLEIALRAEKMITLVQGMEIKSVRRNLVKTTNELTAAQDKWTGLVAPAVELVSNSYRHHLEFEGKWVSFQKVLAIDVEAAMTHLMGVALTGKVPEETCDDSDCRKPVSECTFCDEHYTHDCNRRHVDPDGER